MSASEVLAVHDGTTLLTAIGDEGLDEVQRWSVQGARGRMCKDADRMHHGITSQRQILEQCGNDYKDTVYLRMHRETAPTNKCSQVQGAT